MLRAAEAGEGRNHHSVGISRLMSSLAPWRNVHEHEWSTHTVAGMVRRSCACGVIQIDAADEEVELTEFASRIVRRRSSYLLNAEMTTLLDTGEALG